MTMDFANCKAYQVFIILMHTLKEQIVNCLFKSILNLYFSLGYISNFKELFHVFNCTEMSWIQILMKIRWPLFWHTWKSFSQRFEQVSRRFIRRNSVARHIFLGEVSTFLSKGFIFYPSGKCKLYYINLNKISSLYC